MGVPLVRIRFGLAACVALAGLLGGGPYCAASGAELIGVTEAVFRWAPATGPVAGYYVIVSRNGAPARVEALSGDTTESVTGVYGETIVVRVAAFDAQGATGPESVASEPVTFVAPADPGAGQIAPLDFTGDGRSDLLIRNDNRALVELWTMSGSRVTSTTNVYAEFSPIIQVGNGDYDGDGVSDILWEHIETGDLYVGLVRGSRVTGVAVVDLDSLEPDGAWQVGGSADFDADGRDDLLLFSRRLGVIEILHMHGLAQASRLRLSARTGAWTVVATPDIDGDGTAEIVWRDEIAKRLEVAQLDPAGGLQFTSLSRSVAGLKLVGSGDYDGDGMLDLVMHRTGTGALEFWLFQGAALSAVVTVPETAEAGFVPRAPADYDGDGLVDVVWSNPAQGRVEIWLATEQDVVAEALTGTAIEPGDRIASGVQGSDQSGFYARFCNADVDGSGSVNLWDMFHFAFCSDGPATGGCEASDLDMDGWVTDIDDDHFDDLRDGVACGDGL